MLRHVGILISIYLCVVVQSSLVTELPEAGRPFLPALMLVLIAAWCHPGAAIFWSGFAGLVLDGVSTERLGVQLGLATTVALGLQLLRPVWRSCNTLALLSMVLIAATLWRALSPMTYAMLNGRVIDPHLMLNAAARDAASTAVVAMVLFFARFLFVRSVPRSRNEIASPNRRIGAAAW